jgi:hypothetical protein
MPTSVRTNQPEDITWVLDAVLTDRKLTWWTPRGTRQLIVLDHLLHQFGIYQRHKQAEANYWRCGGFF